jgi:hypothetical protein
LEVESWGLILEIEEWVMGQKGHCFVEPEVPPSDVETTSSPSVLHGSPSGTKVPQVVKVKRKSAEDEDAEGQQSVDAADHKECAHQELAIHHQFQGYQLGPGEFEDEHFESHHSQAEVLL